MADLTDSTSKTTRRSLLLAAPALTWSIVRPNCALANLQTNLIDVSAQSVSDYFRGVGVKGRVSPTTIISTQRGVERMLASDFQVYRTEFEGYPKPPIGECSNRMGVNRPCFSVGIKVESAIRPTKQDGIVYCAAIGTDCTADIECKAVLDETRIVPDRLASGGFRPIDKNVVLIEEANAIGLSKVFAEKRATGWPDWSVGLVYTPIGFKRREVASNGSIRQQNLQWITFDGDVEAEESIDYSRGAIKVRLMARSSRGIEDDYFELSV